MYPLWNYSITNAGSIYSNQLMLAQQVLKMQQHRLEQLHQEEQEMNLRRIQQRGAAGAGATAAVGGAGPIPGSIPLLHDLTRGAVVEELDGGLL